MSTESTSTTYYTAVIKDLRAKRDEIDRIIAALERLSAPVSTRLSPSLPSVAPPAPPVGGIGEACVRVLRRSNTPLTTREVAEAVQAEGFRINSDNPVNNVGSALNHRAKVTGDVERFGPRHWRLVEGQEKSEIAQPTPTSTEVVHGMNGANPH